MESYMRSDLRYLKGIGEQRSKLYSKLGIHTVGDLLYYFPRSYIDITKAFSIGHAPLGETSAVRAAIAGKAREQRIRKGMTVYKVMAYDETGRLELTFYNTKYTAEALEPGREYIFYGRIEGSLLLKSCSSPAVFSVSGRETLIPIYGLTKGLTSPIIRSNVKQALSLLQNSDPDPLPEEILSRNRLYGWQEALHAVHFPETVQYSEEARRRFIFEELFMLSLKLSLIKNRNRISTSLRMSPVDMTSFYASLPFQLTSTQKKAIREISSDVCESAPMNRLLQGDVGSGKTVVAAAGCFLACRSGMQAALMVPTEILAAQHAETLSGLLEPLGVGTALLTGSTTAAEKRRIKAGLADGGIDICVGTHALLTQDTVFKQLGLVITDEQHRFGVGQRLALQQKSASPHILVMSATPIPRTLALIVFGDLDISILDELPPGRQPIATYLIDSAKRQRAFGFIRKHLDTGLQAYIVCPMVESDAEQPTGLMPAVEYARALEQGAFSGYRVGLLHGRLSAKEKEKVMSRFKAGEIQLLVSTTVVEVGVDVPNAVIMMIENAERFGLSQLHQLRGRVGRGKVQSHCILVSDSESEAAQERLKYLCRNTDGYKIAEFDLKQRGPGDFLGYRQHGLPKLRLADLTGDISLLLLAQQDAVDLLESDPVLCGHPSLKEHLDFMSPPSDRLN